MKLKKPMGLLEYQELTLKSKAYCEAYSDYWNSMVVDAVIMPVAPHAAVIPDKFYHLGKPSFEVISTEIRLILLLY
jgi:amidase